MRRPKNECCKLGILGTFAFFIGVILLANLLWASTPTAIACSWKNCSRFAPPRGSHEEPDVPILSWEEVAEAPVRRLDGAAVQIGSSLYVFAGYGTINEVHTHVDIYNVKNNTWEEQIWMPQHMAQSHLGMASDGRYIYVVTGQFGPQCRGATSASFVLDSHTRTWTELPPLPAPRQRPSPNPVDLGAVSVHGANLAVGLANRYAPAAQHWKGRLHVVGGSKENRHEPAVDHWSLAVLNGVALEQDWHREVPIPRGGPHRASAVVQDRLYIIGGQEGDFVAKPGSPSFSCSRQPEVVYGDVFMLEDRSSSWVSLPSMPKPTSHIEFASSVIGRFVVTAGGSTQKSPLTKKMVLLGDVFLFDTKKQSWKTLGQLPYRVKTALVAYWDGWLYVSSGQRDRGVDDPSPRKIVGQTWRTKLSLNP